MMFPELICHDVLQRKRIAGAQRNAVMRAGTLDNVFMQAMRPIEGHPVTLAVLGEGIQDGGECIEYIKEHPEWRPECHGYRHIRYDAVDDDIFRRDMSKTQDLIESAFGRRPTIYIPPYNKYNDASRTACSELGMVQKEVYRKPYHYKHNWYNCSQADFHYWSEKNMRAVRFITRYFSLSPHYIIGAPRSGTTALMRFMSQDDDGLVVLKEKEEPWRRGVDIRQYYAELLYGNGKSRILDKNVRNSFRILDLQNMFPNAQFTHIIRDGRAAISSWRDWARKTGKEDTSIEGAAKQWTEYVNYILNNKHMLHNYKEIRYEEMCFKHDYFVSRNEKWKTRVTKQELDVILQIAGETLRRLGYV